MQREGDGDGVKALALGIANRDGLVFCDVKTNEQYGRLLGCGIGGHRGHLTHAATHREDGAALNHDR